jgi:glycosyltransferase involved in cell wall biosynthesis
MVTLERVASGKVLVMPTAYIPHQESPGSDIRRELGLRDNVPLVAAVGSLREEKAFDVLLDAHSHLLARVPDAQLLIAGDGERRAALERRIAELGLGSSIHLLGWRRDVDALLRQADVGVISSDWEGMPLFAFECMAARTALVATAVGGLPDLVADGETGLLVAPRDPRGLATAIERVVTERDLGKRLARAAAMRLDQFAIDSVARRFADLYEELAMQRAPNRHTPDVR